MRRKTTLSLLTIIFIIIPIILWMTVEPINLRLESPARAIGQISGLLGMSLMSWVIFISARWPVLDRWLLGVNRLYRDHHWLGTIALLLILIHPLALAMRLSLSSATNLFIPWSGYVGVTWGILALGGLIILLVLTFFIKLAYNRWYQTHKFLGLVYIFAFIHMLVIESDISNFTTLRYYYLFLSLLVFISLCYRQIPNRHCKYCVESINQPHEKLFDLWLKPVNKQLNFKPGQFAFLNFKNQKIKSEAHPFTIAGQRADGSIRVIIKDLGDYTKQINHLAINDQALIEGPYGFFGRDLSRPQLWISGGIGFTPFLSLLDALTDKNNVYYYHISSFVEELKIITPDLDQAKINHNFHYQIWDSKQGRITAEQIIKNVIDWQDRDILICGPRGLMDNLKTQFLALGGKPSQLISEDFNLFL